MPIQQSGCNLYVMLHVRSYNTLAQDKRAQVEGDEWARIYEFKAKAGLELEKQQAMAAREKQKALKAILDQQIREVEMRKKVGVHRNMLACLKIECAAQIQCTDPAHR